MITEDGGLKREREKGGGGGEGGKLTQWKMFALQTLDGSIETPREENPPSFSVDNWGGPDRSGPIFGMFARNEKCVANNRRLADNKPLDIVAKAGDNQLELILRLLIGYFFLLQVRFVGFRDRPLEERQMRFVAGCREGHTEIVS